MTRPPGVSRAAGEGRPTPRAGWSTALNRISERVIYRDPEVLAALAGHGATEPIRSRFTALSVVGVRFAEALRVCGGDRNTFERGHQAALSFVDVDQVGDDSYERLSAHCEAVLKFVRIPF